MNDIIDNDIYSWYDTSNDMLRKATAKRSPFVGTIELTARCNLCCEMCYIRRDGTKEVIQNEKTTSEWIDFIEQAAKAGTLFLLFTGGEPLLRPDFRKIYEHSTNLGFNITLYTNATLINEDFMEWISKIPPNKVGVTLYGASPETYKAVTGSASAFEKALKGIDLLLKAGIKVTIRSTICRENAHDVDAIGQIAKQRGLDVEYTFNLIKHVRGAVSNVEKVRLLPSELIKIDVKDYVADEECEDVFKSNNEKARVITEPMFCAAGKSSYWMAWDGKMLPCGLFSQPYSEPFKIGFNQAWEQLKNSINDITSPEECNGCEYRQHCSVCPAKLQAETGSFNKISDFICDSAKILKNSKI